MKTFPLVLVTLTLVAVLYGCAPKYGCPANARNTGAENAENIKHPSRYPSSLNKF